MRRAQSTRLALLFVNLGVNADRIAEAADAILLNADDGRDAYYIAVARISLAILAQERSAATASTDAALAALQTVDALVPTSAFSACDSALDDADALAHLLARQTLRNNEIIPEPSERLTAFMCASLVSSSKRTCADERLSDLCQFVSFPRRSAADDSHTLLAARLPATISLAAGSVRLAFLVSRRDRHSAQSMLLRSDCSVSPSISTALVLRTKS